jgi:hypothetical protein
MIDTVCLLVPLANLDHQTNPSWLSFSGPIKQIIMAPKTYRREGAYFPKLTILRGHFYPEPVMKIEFSAPKLIFGNNLQELSDHHLNEMLRALQTRLSICGLMVDTAVLAASPVAVVHYSKNILLRNGYTANHLISELCKLDYCKQLKASRTRYPLDGSAIYLHNKSHQLVIYDKMADLRNTERREFDRSVEVLRFEVRFCKKRKLNDFFTKIGRKRNPTFSDVFQSELSKQIITHYWEKIVKANESGLFTARGDPMKLLRETRRANPGVKPAKSLYLAGMLMLAREGHGLSELREILAPRDAKLWQRLKADHANATKSLNGLPRDWLIQIESALSEFSPVGFTNSCVNKSKV